MDIRAVIAGIVCTISIIGVVVLTITDGVDAAAPLVTLATAALTYAVGLYSSPIDDDGDA